MNLNCLRIKPIANNNYFSTDTKMIKLLKKSALIRLKYRKINTEKSCRNTHNQPYLSIPMHQQTYAIFGGGYFFLDDSEDIPWQRCPQCVCLVDRFLDTPLQNNYTKKLQRQVFRYRSCKISKYFFFGLTIFCQSKFVYL